MGWAGIFIRGEPNDCADFSSSLPQMGIRPDEMRAFITEMGDMPHSKERRFRGSSRAIAQITITYLFAA